MKAFATNPRNSKGSNPLKSRGISVALYDQIVTVGGIRFFEYELLRQWERTVDPADWRFSVFWPLADSSGTPLAWPFALNSALRLNRIQSDAPSKLVKRLLSSQRLSMCGFERFQKMLAVRIGSSKFMAGRGLTNSFDWVQTRLGRYDLLYCPNPVRNLPDTTSPSLPCPVIITLHDLAHEFTTSWGERTDQIRREVATWCRMANGIVFSSEWVREQAIRLYDIPETRTYRIYLAPTVLRSPPNPADTESVLDKYHLPTGYALCLGASAPHKNHFTILRGLNHLRSEYGITVPLVIAGPQTDAFTPGLSPVSAHAMKMQQAIVDLGFVVGQDIFCLGFVPDRDISALYHGSRMVVTASQSEAGLNAMIFDGMMLERPIVCSDLPQFVERLGDSGKFARIFAADNPQELALAVKGVLDDPNVTGEMVARARNFVQVRTWQDVGQDYLTVFSHILHQ